MKLPRAEAPCVPFTREKGRGRGSVECLFQSASGASNKRTGQSEHYIPFSLAQAKEGCVYCVKVSYPAS
eukprot:1160153-Pelagomonas_calceolata.AAC.2